METVKEVDQDGAEESEENGLAEEDVSYMVGLLQDMSDEYSMKEQDPCDLYDSSDWDEAVHGWNRVSALSCMFLPARNCRRTKSDEQDPHCLLCVDIRPLEALTPDWPPEFDPESDGNPQESDATVSGTQKKLYNTTVGSSPLKEAHQNHLVLGDKMADDTEVPREVLQPLLTDYLYQDHLCSKDPALMSLQPDLGNPINSFTVLPPLRAPQLASQGVVRQVCVGESLAGGGSAAGGSAETGGVVAPTAAREGRGAKRTEETGGADTLTNTEPTKDTHRPSAPPKGMYCCHSQEKNRHLLSTYTLPILKRYSVPLGKITDTMHRTTVSLGHHWRQALRTGSEYSRHERSPTPQLPVLFGTKVPIVVSSQRPL
ncbi:unnamed protein product [Boreogadus saida]